ncbi:hypothetical protein ACWDXD_19935 [Streptomyces sp. NPDC003314]
MNPNEVPREGLCGRLTDEQGEKVVREVRAENGPQTGVWSSSPVEIHHWDAEKLAEVARLLDRHPPRPADYSTTTVGQPLDN